MKKVLITYASKFGATAGIAEKIQASILDSGLEADLLAVNEVVDIEKYHAIILGSAVYYGRWRKDAVQFLTNNEEILKSRETWFFSSGPLGEGDPVELLDGWTFPPLQQEIADRIQPNGTVVFHGLLDEKKLNFFERWVLKKLDSPTGDFRKWDQIADWANSIAKELK